MNRARNHQQKHSPAQKTAERDSNPLFWLGVAVSVIFTLQMISHVWADSRAGRFACALAKEPPREALCISERSHEQCTALVEMLAVLEWREDQAVLRQCARPDPVGFVFAWAQKRPEPDFTLQADPEPDTETEAIALEVAHSEE